MGEEFSSEELFSDSVSEEVSSEEVVSETVSEEVSSEEVVSEPVSEEVNSEEVSSEVVVDYSSQLQQINTGLVVVSSLLFAILLGACLYGLVKWFTRLFR